MHELVREKLVEPLHEVVGHVLRRTIYRCMNWECTYEDIEGPLFYTGGEVELRFDDSEDQATLFVSWGGGSPKQWKEEHGVYYFIQASLWEPFVRASGIEVYDATHTPLWSPLIGTRLSKVEVLGENGIPYVLKFHFTGGAVYIGTGTVHPKGWGFGDMDETLVRSEEEVAEWAARWAASWPDKKLELITVLGEG